ncbi:hypothetical protein M514_24056 [Trichuris suis]|uniref:Uncharacterized protein n=1 Tax=Trichuris suis TaxID=68888 RepID=A0A085N2V2_9BILA|nr:hypothetical protein M514_24056 [Trichuris suis]
MHFYTANNLPETMIMSCHYKPSTLAIMEHIVDKSDKKTEHNFTDTAAVRLSRRKARSEWMITSIQLDRQYTHP